jgi:hypothetical protein
LLDLIIKMSIKFIKCFNQIKQTISITIDDEYTVDQLHRPKHNATEQVQIQIQGLSRFSKIFVCS